MKIMFQESSFTWKICLGTQGQDVLAELFSMSEVGMFPSYKEPFGMVFIECMACGTPTIGANSGGPTEFVKPEQGVLIEEEADWRTEAGMQRQATCSHTLQRIWYMVTSHFGFVFLLQKSWDFS